MRIRTRRRHAYSCQKNYGQATAVPFTFTRLYRKCCAGLNADQVSFASSTPYMMISLLRLAQTLGLPPGVLAGTCILMPLLIICTIVRTAPMLLRRGTIQGHLLSLCCSLCIWNLSSNGHKSMIGATETHNDLHCHANCLMTADDLALVRCSRFVV